jgi:hypothetical protein
MDTMPGLGDADRFESTGLTPAFWKVCIAFCSVIF